MVTPRFAHAGTPVEGFVVQRMAQAGVEMLVGVVSDPEFGSVVACAAGGTAVEMLGDVQVRLAPVAHSEAASMIRALRTFPLLDGVAAMAAARPEIGRVEELLLGLRLADVLLIDDVQFDPGDGTPDPGAGLAATPPGRSDGDAFVLRLTTPSAEYGDWTFANGAASAEYGDWTFANGADEFHAQTG